MNCTVYSVTHRATGDEYVGVTTRPVERRWSQHRCDARKGHGNRLAAALAKHGPDAFDFRVVAALPDIEMARNAERTLVSERKPAFNMTPGGDTAPFMSPAVRAHISARMKGVQLRLGHTVSVETRAKIAKALTGRRQSEATRAKYVGRPAPNKGKPMPEAQKRALSDARRGVKPSPEIKAKRLAALAVVRATPEYREKLSQAVRAWWAARKAST
jgi:predicted GIY-YIG superfamily endonuclease